MQALPELELQPGTLFIGDLHLDPADRAGPAAFASWLDARGGTPRLVILGDLFEYWIGPAQARAPETQPVLEALGRLTTGGCRVDVVPGNRDFLLDADFEGRTGARLRHAGFVGLLHAGASAEPGRVLVVHGDELCTLDRPYQRLRRVLRSRPVRWTVPRLPVAVAEAVARKLRRSSRTAVARKPTPSMMQQADACRALTAAQACTMLICGHVHRYRDEQLPGGPRWLVVDAYGGPRDTVRVGAGGELSFQSSTELPR